MLYIDPSKLIGRKFYVHDKKVIYTAVGYGQNDTTFIVGEYADPTYACNRITTHKMSDCKFMDFVTAAPTPCSPP